ncbi:GH1 family beta-glucosidase [Inhella sp.]|uniref:GH1 family beta-glucosidase n=1 Tax=Inhella sp. TaxID=1921806 RepID=UPI0035AE3BDB
MTADRFPERSAFPPGFLFGAATSAYQIEGAVEQDGRGPSWWDRFAHTPGCIRDGSSGDQACEHYQRWREDLDLMHSLNLQAYRFSVAWPRVLPDGRGRLNPAGLDFYERLVDGLLERGIVPYATLYHWDLPLTLADAGGWQSRDTSSAFADYAVQVMRRLGDRVARWSTLNEPRCSAYVGHLEGRHAPGLRDLRATLSAAHHLLLGHGLAMQAMRAESPSAQLGIVLDVKPYTAADEGAVHQQAAWRADGVFNRWFLDPLFRAEYPTDVLAAYAAHMPDVLATDLATIAQPLDHLGLNYYTRGHVLHDPSRPFPQAAEQRVNAAHHSTMEWEDWQEGLYRMLTRIHREYAPKALFVAENGAAEPDRVDADGRVRDPDRQRYLQGHLRACAKALAEGVPLDAYLVWSLMDNFEWGRGYTQRFGLVHVDYASQRRTPKESALAYAAFIRS